MKDILQTTIKSIDADYVDIRIEKTSRVKIIVKKNALNEACPIIEQGGIVRALKDGAWGISTFNSLDFLEKAAKNAEVQAKLLAKYISPEKKFTILPKEAFDDFITVDLKEDFRNVAQKTKKDLCLSYSDIIMSHSNRIISSLIKYVDTYTSYYFASSDGIYIEEQRPDISIHIMATAKNAETVQVAYEGDAGKKGFELVKGLEKDAKKAAINACDLLDAKPIAGNVYNVILDPILAGTFIHEAFGHLSEADQIYANPKLQEMMKLGKKVGSDILNVLDDGSIGGLRGTHKYDDEGVKTKKNYLIRNGELVGRLHSRETASKLSEETTGNARALDYNYEPIVRMTNTYIDSCKSTFEDLLKEMNNGIYACDFFGGTTALEMFTFSAGRAYVVENGAVKDLLRNVVLSGNLFSTLHNIKGIANKLSWEEIGGCGKDGQSGLPTPHASPHIWIKDIVVGGE
ncbi:MAG: TldD/PmbA family protein [Pseudomonadota bacterium]